MMETFEPEPHERHLSLVPAVFIGSMYLACLVYEKSVTRADLKEVLSFCVPKSDLDFVDTVLVDLLTSRVLVESDGYLKMDLSEGVLESLKRTAKRSGNRVMCRGSGAMFRLWSAFKGLGYRSSVSTLLESASMFSRGPSTTTAFVSMRLSGLAVHSRSSLVDDRYQVFPVCSIFAAPQWVDADTDPPGLDALLSRLASAGVTEMKSFHWFPYDDSTLHEVDRRTGLRPRPRSASSTGAHSQPHVAPDDFTAVINGWVRSSLLMPREGDSE